jgi:hypothetical protein
MSPPTDGFSHVEAWSLRGRRTLFFLVKPRRRKHGAQDVASWGRALAPPPGF